MRSPCESTGDEKTLTSSQSIQKRYYLKHYNVIREKAKLKREKEKSMRLKKLCPSCNKEMHYTNQSNLQESIKKQLKCKSCVHKDAPYEYLFNSLIYRCKQRRISCDLIYQEFLEFTKIIACQYCQAKIEWVPYNSNKSLRGYKYNLDRMNNNFGYTKLNCCVCCSMCNKVKSNVFTYSEMVELGKIIKTIQEMRA